MCRVVVLEGPECWQHRAYSVIIVDTRNSSTLGGKVFSNGIEFYVILNQNSSADRLGLNPAGLTKWEKHNKNV